MEIRTQQLAMVSKNYYIKELSNTNGNHYLAVSSSQELFKNIKGTIEGSLNVYYGGEYGEIVGVTKVKSISEFKYTDREWYIKAKEANGKAIFTTPSEDKETGKQVMTIAQAVKDDSGKFLGVLAIDINIDFMHEYVESIKLKNTGYVMLANNDGSIIVNNDKYGDNSISELQFWNQARNEESGIYEWVNGKNLMFVSQVTNKDTGWKLVGYVDGNEILNDVSGIKLTIIIAAVICLIISCIVGTVTSIAIVNQIKKVNKSIGKVSNGDLTEKIHISTNNEFGELGENFNTMVNNISELIYNVEKTSVDLLEAATNISSMSEETTASISEGTNTIGTVAVGASNQAQASQNANKKVDDLANKINEVKNGADKINSLSNNTVMLSNQGLIILDDLITKAQKTRENSIESTKIVTDMGKSIEKINYISSVIADITKQIYYH